MSRRHIRWSGVEAVNQRLDAYERLFVTRVIDFAWLWAVKLENYAKRHHPWTNRTHAAELGLHAYVDPPKYNGLVTGPIFLWLSHGANVDYALDLELGYAGKYAIIYPTISDHADEIRRDLETAFGVQNGNT